MTFVGPLTLRFFLSNVSLHTGVVPMGGVVRWFEALSFAIVLFP